MVLDEPKQTDEVFEIDGFTYLIDKHLLGQAQPIEVDCSASGFRITGNPDFQGQVLKSRARTRSNP